MDYDRKLLPPAFHKRLQPTCGRNLLSLTQDDWSSGTNVRQNSPQADLWSRISCGRWWGGVLAVNFGAGGDRRR